MFEVRFVYFRKSSRGRGGGSLSTVPVSRTATPSRPPAAHGIHRQGQAGRSWDGWVQAPGPPGPLSFVEEGGRLLGKQPGGFSAQWPGLPWSQGTWPGQSGGTSSLPPVLLTVTLSGLNVGGACDCCRSEGSPDPAASGLTGSPSPSNLCSRLPKPPWVGERGCVSPLTPGEPPGDVALVTLTQLQSEPTKQPRPS